MPGRIIMEQQSAIGSQDLKKDRSQAQIAQGSPAVQAQAVPQVNGVVAHTQNGGLTNGAAFAQGAPSTTNGAVHSPTMAPTDPSTPPPLDEAWREGESNKRLGTLLERTAQQCYVDLMDTLSRMQAVGEEASKPQGNGTTQPSGPDTSEPSLKKKRMLMDFANSQRERFIKTLVLSNWSRNEEDQTRLIDLKVWQDDQRRYYTWANDAIGHTKVDMINVKVPNPNIEGAMEILSTGQASWVPHMGYIPPKRASAKQVLKTLKNMNVMIATRLSLRDELPPYMQNYSVANGRVTFAVPGEFEVDLSLVEDESQYFFVDLRLAFKPSASTINSNFRDHLEGRVNAALEANGLQGCYDFLHDLVLTHKINVLRSQVFEIMQDKWFDCIRAENLRRSLAVQYWTNRPGPKSWIEIGISSGKAKALRKRKPATPEICVRWFQGGIEVKDQSFDFDWVEAISLEKCLTTVINKHISLIIGQLRTRMEGLARKDSALSVEMGTLAEGRVALNVALPSLRTPLTLRVETVTGNFSILPPSLPTTRAERRMNSDPSADFAQWLANTACAVVQERVHKEAEILRWTGVPTLVKQDNLNQIFGEDVRLRSYFVPKNSWGDGWALCVTFNWSGESWWVASLKDQVDENGNITGKTIAAARRLTAEWAEKSTDTVSRKAFISYEDSAAAKIAFGMLSKQFCDLQVPHRLEKTQRMVANNDADVEHRERPGRAMFFDFAKLMSRTHSKQTKARTMMARTTHHRMNYNASTGLLGAFHELHCVVRGLQLHHLGKDIAQFRDRDLVIHESGSIAFRILVSFGNEFVEQIKQRVTSVERLDHFVRSLERHGLHCSHVNLTRFSFVYDVSLGLGATLTTSSDATSTTKLKLHPTDTNPHARVRVMLEKGLNETGDQGVEALIAVLRVTLPLLQAFDRMETASATRRAVVVLPRSATYYTVEYKAPLPICSFDVRLRHKVTGSSKNAYWQVNIHDRLSDSNTELNTLLAAQLWRATDQKWKGLGRSLLADAHSIGAAMDRVDELIRGFQSSTEQPSGPSMEMAPSVVDPAQAQGQSSQEPPQQQQQQHNKEESDNGTAAPKKEEPDVIMLD